MSDASGFSADAGASLGDSIGNSVSTERAPSGLARFFGTNPFRDRGGM